jgi:hypothetical protein
MLTASQAEETKTIQKSVWALNRVNVLDPVKRYVTTAFLRVIAQ